MRLLELFSGTQSVGKVARELGYEVVSLDRDMNADLKMDIMDWDYTLYPPRSFDVIWASPPCTEYSRAKTVGVRKIDEANEIVMRTFEIIVYLLPKFYILENPQTGLLKSQNFMTDLHYYDVDYCKYGMPYRKRTRLWTNLTTWTPRPLCKKDCDSMTEDRTRHIEQAQRLPTGAVETWANQRRHTREELYKIPPDLIKDLFTEIALWL